ncbi:MAG: 5'/3'-nucleotidase SurE [Candidatus Aminicenantales bacterium]
MNARPRLSRSGDKAPASGKPLILLTNDDGYFSPGIEALAIRVRKFANAYIVAPDRERSAQSLSLTLRRPLRIHRIRPRVFSVDGTPADCVYLALKKLLPRTPDLILSGMNLGPNIGRQDISYSGTVAAAIQGTYLGIPSVAFSLLPDGRGRFDPPAAAPFAEEIVRRLLRKRLPEGVTLNVNIPSPPVRGFRIANLGQKKYDPEIIVRKAPRDIVSYWIGPGHPVPSGDGDSDVHASGLGFITLTPLHTDLTDYAMMGSPILKSLCSRKSRG